jgi:Transglutaminase-like superfamily
MPRTLLTGSILLLMLLPLMAAPDDLLKDVPEKWRGKAASALSGSGGSAFRAAMEKLDPEERVGCAFLLANMPPHHRSKLTEAVLVEHVRYAYKARRELAWTKSLPEEIFYHYVLPILSGDEKIEAYRKVFWEQALPKLRQRRVRTLEEAALEVNRWCGSKVSFKSTPPEDSSPLEIMERGYGRCEEEGIFFNAVARSVGVPARIASTPYWTFKASNHAWCEVYTGAGDRPWHFLGACEPSGKLDQGWFKGDVKRAALVLSRAIGRPEGDQVLSDRGGVSVINSTKYYTKTCAMTLNVKDTEGAAAPGAELAMYIWNEVGNEPRLYDVFRAKADEKGRFTFDLGPGDYVIQARKGGESGIGVARSKPGKKAETEIVIGAPAPTAGREEENGTSGVRLMLGPGAKDSIVGICAFSAFPLTPTQTVNIGKRGETIPLSPGRYFLQTGRRKGDAAIHLTLQVVLVKAGVTTTIAIPGKFPKNARTADVGNGMFLMTYPR